MPSKHRPPSVKTADREPRSVSLLIKAAKALITDGQMDSVTVDDIVRMAGVSKRSFYNHFTDREALTSHVMDAAHRDLSEQVRKACVGIKEPAERMTRAMLAILGYCYDHPFGENMLARVATNLSNSRHAGIQSLTHELRDGVKKRVFRPASIEAGIVLAFGACVVGASRLQQFRNKPAHAHRLMRATCIAVLRGLRLEAGGLEALVDAAMAATQSIGKHRP